jgi:hypothetical protein
MCVIKTKYIIGTFFGNITGLISNHRLAVGRSAYADSDLPLPRLSFPPPDLNPMEDFETFSENAFFQNKKALRKIHGAFSESSRSEG